MPNAVVPSLTTPYKTYSNAVAEHSSDPRPFQATPNPFTKGNDKYKHSTIGTLIRGNIPSSSRLKHGRHQEPSLPVLGHLQKGYVSAMQIPETFVNQIRRAKIVKSFLRDKNTPLALFRPLLHAAQSTFLALIWCGRCRSRTNWRGVGCCTCYVYV